MLNSAGGGVDSTGVGSGEGGGVDETIGVVGGGVDEGGGVVLETGVV